MDVSTKIFGMCAILIAAAACHRESKYTEPAAVRVKTEAVESQPVTGGRSYSGTVEESTGTALSFPVAGTVRQFNVSVGDKVAKGQLIATLDATSLRNAYEISLAALDEAEDAYSRMKQLHDAQALPDIKWVQAQSTLSQARSAAAIARKALDDANLYAPRAGYISEKTADAGVNVAPGIPVVKVVDINPVKVNISVPENEIASMPAQARARVTVSALSGRVFEGVLKEKGVAANPLSRSYDVKFEVQNPQGDLLPGMICDVQMLCDSAQSVLTVPVDAVMLDAGNHNFVWVSRNGVAEKRIVDVSGMTGGTRLIVNSGLSHGDSVIVSGQQKVSQGTRVVNISL